jgi:hypothetical protein
MPLDFDQLGRKERDQKLRREILEQLYFARHSPGGGWHGRPLVAAINEAAEPGMGFEDDTHALQIIRDMVNFGFVEQQVELRRRGERLSPGHLFLRITGLGTQLKNESIDPHPDVWDERIAGDK